MDKRFEHVSTGSWPHDGRAAALLSAAKSLRKAGRSESCEILLRSAMATGFGLSLARELASQALEEDDPDLAAMVLTIAVEVSRERELPAWAEALERALADRQPFCSGMLRSQLSALPIAETKPGTGPLCYVLHMSLPESTTGYAMRSHSFMQALREINFPFHCITRLGFPPVRAGMDQIDVEVVDGLTYHRLPRNGPLRKNSGYVEDATQALIDRLLPLRPAALMAASNHQNAAPALLAARRMKIPFIYDIRGFWELSRLSNFPQYLEDPQFRISYDLETEIARQADLVFTLSDAMRRELLRRGVTETPIELLPNAADPKRFQPVPRDADLAGSLAIPGDVAVIGYIGSFNPYEGLDDLARACASLHRGGHDFRLLLVGEEPKHLRGRVTPEVRRIAAEAGYAHKLIMPGRVAGADVDRWYSLIDIAPIPRKALPVTELVPPMKPLEAMAMEKAVLVTDLPALCEIVQDGRTGLIVARDNPRALADGLERLIQDPALRHRLGCEARRWVETERNWPMIARRCREVIRKTLAI